MTILVNIIIGVIMGIAIVGVANFLKKPQDNKAKQISFGVVGVLFGALGSVAADQLLIYGPNFLGVSLLPSMVGGLVLAFVVVYPMKRWFKF